MNSKPTKAHLAELVAHTVATLPDSLRKRKVLLVTLHSLLPRASEERQALRTVIETLAVHESTQLKFAAIIRHDGHNPI